MTGTVYAASVSVINSVYRDISAFGAQPTTALTDFYRNTSGSPPPNFVTASQSSVPTSSTIAMGNLLNTFNGHQETVSKGYADDGTRWWQGSGSPTGTSFGWSYFMQTATAGAGFLQPVHFSFHDFGYLVGGFPTDYSSTFLVIEGDVRTSTLGTWWTYIEYSWSDGWGVPNSRILYRAEASENYQPFNPKQSPNEYVAWEWNAPGSQFPYEGRYSGSAGTATLRLYK